MEKEKAVEFLTFLENKPHVAIWLFIKYKFNQTTTIDLHISFTKTEIKNETITFYKTQFIKY